MGLDGRDQLKQLVESQPTFKGVRGAILRIKIIDFMTYHIAELHAGPNVNLILGPNGTGKSTIVCAICIGLAGKPRILGRASCLKEYIRHGCHSATIEIELYNPGGINYIIKRHIKEAGTGVASTWFVNGIRSQSSRVEELLLKLNIQLDNLCQFLPQDRVQEFSKMDAYSLLRSTQEAVGKETLSDKHDRLITLKELVKQLEYTIKTNNNTLRTEQLCNQRIENEVDNYHERERMKDKIDKLVGKKAWLVYAKTLNTFSQLKAELERMQAKKQEEVDMLRPHKQELQVVVAKLAKFKLEMNRARSTNISSMNALKRKYEDDSNEIEVKVNAINAELAVHEKVEEDRKTRIEACTAKIYGLQREFEELQQGGNVNTTVLTEQIEELNRIDSNFSETIFKIQQDNETAELDKRSLQGRIRQTEAELNRLDDMRVSRLKFLQRENNNAFRAVEFFSKDENKAKLRGRVHEPMALHLCVKDLNYGSLVERHIGMAEMTSFFCDDKEDLEVMLELCKQEGIRISITHHVLPRNWRPPPSGLNPAFSRRYDFQNVVSDLIDGPDYYLSYLCERFKIYSTPVGSPRTDSLFARITEETNLSMWYTSNTVYSAKKSNYRSAKCSSIEYLSAPKIFTSTINQLEKDRLLKRKNEALAELKRVEDEMRARLPELERCEAERTIAENKIKDIRARMHYAVSLRTKIESCMRAKEGLERAAVDLTTIRKNAQKSIYEERKKVFIPLKFVISETTKNSRKGLGFVVLGRQVILLERLKSTRNNIIQDLTRSIQEHTDNIREMEKEIKETAKAAEKQKEEAVQLSQLQEAPTDVAEGRVKLEQVEIEIARATCQIAFLMDADESVVNEYHQRLVKIDKITREKIKHESRLAELKEEIIKKKEEWLTPLKLLIYRINDNFGLYFANMGCAGEVSLLTPDDENDFEKFGIKIMVKFRASEELSEMCGASKGGTLQSGGERVITTALYVLALQELTVVPFRVIDEINQGMDAKNEARFFNLLCSLAKGENTPQYFLITPKMLPRVDYPDNVLFHFIMNGPLIEIPLDTPDKEYEIYNSSHEVSDEEED